MYDPMASDINQFKALKPFVGGTWHTSKCKDADLRSTYFDRLVFPDGALYPQALPDGVPVCSARHMASYFEFKINHTHDPFSTRKSGQDSIENDTAISEYVRGQLTLYRKALQSTQQRTHIFAIFIIKDKCRLLCHTRTGTLVTQKFSYINTPFLQEFIWWLTRAPLSDVGYDETFMPVLANDDLAVHLAEAREYLHASPDDTLFRVAVDTVKSTSDTKRTWYIVCKPFTFAHRLPVGRGTQCFVAFDVQRKCVVLLKDQWRAARYTAEGKVYVRLQHRKVKHILRLIAHGDVPGQRCGHEVLDVISGAVRQELIHTRVVLDAVGKPLHHFASTWELVCAMRDVIVAHRDAFQNAQILHRDMSEGNWIIVHGRGYLIDWELSNLLTLPDPQVAERTGTWQFMSIRLLNYPSKHEVRDDLEAAIWVLFWTLIKYSRNALSPAHRLWRLGMFEYHPIAPSFRKEDFAWASGNGIDIAEMMGVHEPPQLVELINKLGFAIAANNSLVGPSDHNLETHDWILSTLNAALGNNDWKLVNDPARKDEADTPAVEIEEGIRKKAIEPPVDARDEHKKRRLCIEDDANSEEECEEEEADESHVPEDPDSGELGL
ncbi:hypothetical protein DL96DRAFT_1497989 [Flagelloscypha sp. PMI_526]|nr:hypothetical protein DL96DRAFT_1497989 [Flagelloscypha sp. PMI_526]